MSAITCRVANLPKDLIFVSDSQDVEPIKKSLGEKAKEFSSFFVSIKNGNYVDIFGIHGIIPLTGKTAVKLQ